MTVKTDQKSTGVIFDTHEKSTGVIFDVQTDRRLKCPGVTLAYGVRGGAGSPVLLIMGYGVPGSAWVHQVSTLAASHQIAWYDHRGCGATEAAPGPYTMELLAADAVRLMDHLGWPEAHVVGVSMGGMVAQRLALDHRDRVRSLALIATHPGGLRARAPRAVGVIRFLRANRGSRKKRYRALQRLLFPDEFLTTCDRRWLAAVLKADFGTPIPLRYRLSQLCAVSLHDTRASLHQLKGLPTLVVMPTLDVLVRPSQSDRLARLIPGARLVTFPEAGHGVIRQCYATLNPMLLEHMAAANQSGRASSRRPWPASCPCRWAPCRTGAPARGSARWSAACPRWSGSGTWWPRRSCCSPKRPSPPRRGPPR